MGTSDVFSRYIPRGQHHAEMLANKHVTTHAAVTVTDVVHLGVRHHLQHGVHLPQQRQAHVSNHVTPQHSQ